MCPIKSYNIPKDNNGYIALITVLILTAVVLLLALNASFFGMSESEMGLDHQLSTESYWLANACAEEALNRLKDDSDYAGDEDLMINDQQCHIYLVKGTGNNYRTIETAANILDRTKKIKVKISQLNPETIIQSWLEVADF